MRIVWTDDRDGRTWEVRNNAPQALAIESFELRARPPEFEDRILFQHPPRPPYVVQASAPNPDARLVGDIGDEELQALLDQALRKAAGGGVSRERTVLGRRLSAP